METSLRREKEPDDKMRQRVRNTGIVSVSALAAMGAVGIGQAALAERQPVGQAKSVSAEDSHVARIEAEHPSTRESIDKVNSPEKSPQYGEPATWWPTEVKQHWSVIQATANEYLLDPYLVATIVAEESMGRNISNSSGAEGLMQIMPSTAQEIARLRHRAYYNMQDVGQNLDFGCWLIHYLDDKYIKARGIDINSDMGIAMLAVYYGDGEGAGEVWARNGYKHDLLSEQASRVAPLWTGMYHDRTEPKSQLFEKTRGK